MIWKKLGGFPTDCQAPLALCPVVVGMDGGHGQRQGGVMFLRQLSVGWLDGVWGSYAHGKRACAHSVPVCACC